MHPELFRIFGYIAKKDTTPHKAYSKLIAMKVEYDNHFPLYGASLLTSLYLQVTVTLAYIITVVFRCFAVQMYSPVCSAVTFGDDKSGCSSVVLLVSFSYTLQVLALDRSPCDKIWRETFNIAGQMQSLTVPHGCLSR